MMAEVSGRALLGLLGFAKGEGGSSAIDQVLGALPKESSMIFDTRVQALRYYPYPTYIELLHSLHRRFAKPGERFYRRLGATAGRRDLGTMFKIYVALASPERLIRSCSKVWASYYKNAGAMEAMAWDPEGTRLRVTGFRAMDTAHCELMEGWMIATMDQIGVVVSDDARETTCMSRGAPHHEFACTWRSR
ncbi:hypothetical protein BH09MYX1_BH09MYX1_49460 [soil metagenome]